MKGGEENAKVNVELVIDSSAKGKTRCEGQKDLDNVDRRIEANQNMQKKPQYERIMIALVRQK